MRSNHLTKSRPGALWLLGASLVLVGACGGVETVAEDSSPARSGPGSPPVLVVATASLETVPRTLRASGSLEPLRRVSPGTKVLGRVEEVVVREGDRVREGALLARLESRDLEAAVRQAEAGVRMAEAQAENARIQHDRFQDLHRRGSVTDKNLEDVQAAFRVAEASLDEARANLAAVRVTLGYAEIRSPLAGWVVDKRIEAGDMATPGAPLFTLEDLSQVQVHVLVPEADVVGLEEGAPARVEVLDREVEARVHRIVPAGDPASRTFSVKLLLDNRDGALKSGMFARVSFVRGQDQALRVPNEALITRGQLQGLFVAGEDGRVRLRWIRTGRSEGGRTEVLSGLDAGERYIVTPPPGLTDGTPFREGNVG